LGEVINDSAFFSGEKRGERKLQTSLSKPLLLRDAEPVAIGLLGSFLEVLPGWEITGITTLILEGKV
jgi:hypothetical protein